MEGDASTSSAARSTARAAAAPSDARSSGPCAAEPSVSWCDAASLAFTSAADGRSPTSATSTSSLFSRQSTNWPSSLADTSAITPRPNWATRPVTVRSVTTVTGRAVAVGRERGGDRGVGVALAPGVAPLGPQHRPVRVVVALDEPGRALVLGGDRADLDLDDAPVLVALDLLELGARHARGDELDVGEHRPRPLDGHAPPGSRSSAPWDPPGSVQVARSSTVSMSAARPGHGTSTTRSGRRRITTRAPSSPADGSSGQAIDDSRTGLPRSPS